MLSSLLFRTQVSLTISLLERINITNITAALKQVIITLETAHLIAK